MRRLSKADIYQTLLERFKEGFVKLSQIPQPHTLKDMQKAANRIKEAIEKRQKIVVVGDYDVDGVVSTALMHQFFDSINYPITSVIPNRFKHGYGLSKSIVEELEDVDLIITVDNGISAIEAASYCKEMGIDLIITDHHTPSDTLPDAYAIVNPKQKSCNFAYEEICGAQVAWFLIGELKKQMGLSLDMRQFLDLLAIAIVADMMPLRHINRSLLQAGLRYLEESQRPAVKFLRTTLKKSSFNSEDLGFSIAPILNSAGRMEDAQLALQFLLAPSFFEASLYYARLLALNSMRKSEEKRVFEESLAWVKADDAVIVSAGEDWNEGVVGIVAARLVDQFQKPSIVLTKKGSSYKGSARSLGAVDLYGLLQKSATYLDRFGGHKKAAGLALKEHNLEPFRQVINRHAAKLPQELFFEEESVLGELPFQEIDWELIEILERFAPYGESNPMPKFAAFNVEILEKRLVGEEKNHLLLTLQQNGSIFRAIKFKHPQPLQSSVIDIIYYPVRNIFNNSQNIQLYITKIN